MQMQTFDNCCGMLIFTQDRNKNISHEYCVMLYNKSVNKIAGNFLPNFLFQMTYIGNSALKGILLLGPSS